MYSARPSAARASADAGLARRRRPGDGDARGRGLAEIDAVALRRLSELGFLPGEPVRLMRRGPGGREPLAVQVGDTLFALRWSRRVASRCAPKSIVSDWP